MTDSNIVSFKSPVADGLTEFFRDSARQMLIKALELEVSAFLAQHSDLEVDGKQAVVRNGYQPERAIQTGLGDIPVRMPKTRDRSGQGLNFNSKLVPPYLKRTKSVEEFIPWLYLKGISTGDMQPALETLLGEGAKGLSSNTVSRLKQVWEQEYDQFRQRDLSRKRYVYIWADGVYSHVRMDDKLCLLVLLGSDDTGRKEVLAVVDGYRESEAGWAEVIQQLRSQGLAVPPKLVIGDGALGLWSAVTKHWPTAKHQRCWVHKTANVLNKVPKSVQPKMKEALHDIWMSETKKNAHKAYDSCVARFETKYPKAIACLQKDKDQMLAFYDFPAEHWSHIRTTNPIESVFATVRLRTNKTKNCGNRKTTLAMAFKLIVTAQNKWRRLRGYKLLADVVKGVKFKDGERIEVDQLDESLTAIHQI